MQPDSIIPNPANPQSFNRYAYVLNRPINFNDPTGHDSACGSTYSDPECPETPPVLEPAESLPGEGNGGCTGIPDCGLNIDDETPVIYPFEPLVDLSQNEPGNNYSTNEVVVDQPNNIFDILWFYVNAMGTLDLIEDGMLWGRPVYKQIKYAIPLGVFEYLGDGILQLSADRYNNLTPEQRMVRGLIRGGESAFIDAVSFGVGLSTGLALQATVPIPYLSAGTGYVLGSYSTSAILDNFVENVVNPYIFDNRFLGGP